MQTITMINMTYHDDDIIRDTLHRLLKEKNLFNIIADNTTWTSQITDLTDISRKIPGVLFILNEYDKPNRYFLSGEGIDLVPTPIRTPVENTTNPRYELSLLNNAHFSDDFMAQTLAKNLDERNLRNYLEFIQSNSNLNPDWPNCITDLKSVSSKMQDTILLLNYKEFDQSPTNHFVYFVDGHVKQPVTINITNKYRAKLLELFPDIENPKNIAKISDNDDQKTYLVYRRHQIKMLTLDLNKTGEILITTDMYYDCPSETNYELVVKFLSAALKNINVESEK